MKSDIYCEGCKEQLELGEPWVAVNIYSEEPSRFEEPQTSRFCVPCGLVELASAAAHMLRGGADE